MRTKRFIIFFFKWVKSRLVAIQHLTYYKSINFFVFQAVKDENEKKEKKYSDKMKLRYKHSPAIDFVNLNSFYKHLILF